MKLKYLTEQRAENQSKMQEMLNGAKDEKRAMTEEEIKKFKELKKMIDEIDETIKAEEIARKEELDEIQKEETDKQSESAETTEQRAFANFIRGIKAEKRANNLDLGNNGAIVPQTIANKIIEKVKEICPIYSLSEIYNVKGDLVIPYYSENAGEDITCAYATEFTDLTSTAGKFTSINLSSYLAGALTKISKSLINKSDFDLTNFVINKMSAAIAEFIEKELLSGTGTNACQGVLTGATNIVESSTSGKVSADDLIDLQESVIDNYQKNAVFIMNRSTRKAIRKLKDGDGNYLLNRDITSAWGYSLLGKPVYTSENMPEIGVNKKAIIYGDMTGLSVKLAKDVEFQVLQELYAAQHALGVVGWVEIDGKVTDQQKLAVLKIKS
nr:MAG TPA: major capsid protein [Caudoviricetes sp.]